MPLRPEKPSFLTVNQTLFTKVVCVENMKSNANRKEVVERTGGKTGGYGIYKLLKKEERDPALFERSRCVYALI